MGGESSLQTNGQLIRPKAPITRIIFLILFFFFPHLHFLAEVGGMCIGKLGLHMVYQSSLKLPTLFFPQTNSAHSAQYCQIITDCTDIKSTIRKYYEQLYANKYDKLDGIDKAL